MVYRVTVIIERREWSYSNGWWQENYCNREVVEKRDIASVLNRALDHAEIVAEIGEKK